MLLTKPVRLVVATVALGLAALAVAASGRTGPFTAAPLTLASGPSPFADCTVGGGSNVLGSPGVNFVNSEVEPWVAVNPTNPKNIVAVFQQDRWSNGGAHGLVTAVSHDSGVTWTSTFAHFSTCSGGTPANGGDFDRASDPWVTFAPNGAAYQISLSASADLSTTAMLVSKSTDGGATWSEPTTLIRETSEASKTALVNFNDKESITADPTNPNIVYAVWDRSRFPSEGADLTALQNAASIRGDIIFTRTTNAGASWATPRDVLALNKNEFTVGNQIVVMPNGDLVDIFNRFKGSGLQPPQAGQITEAVIRSTDKGVTWSKPIDIATALAVAARDPDTGARIRAGEGLPDIAVDPNAGTLYAVWTDSRFSGGVRDDIALSRSSDGGRSWSTPIKVNQTPAPVPAFTPSVEVAADGTVAVTYYDVRNNTPDPTTLPTDYFVVHSHDHGATFSAETRLTPASFDLRSAPFARGFFLGDYQGLATIGNTFAQFFIQANSGNTANPTDAFFTTAGP